MAKRKKTSTKIKRSNSRSKRNTPSIVQNGAAIAQNYARFVLPLIVICVLLAAIGFLGLMGIRTAAASSFFGLRNVEIRGTERASQDDIRRLVAMSAEKTGVWNADVADIKAKVEKFPFVKTASVSRILPATIRVSITERVPSAIVHLSSGDFLIDSDGAVLTAATANDKDFPFVLYGWDESKTEKAIPDNQNRLKMYKKMLEDWKPFDLASRVRQVNLANVREPVAVIEDSGRTIPITLAKDNIGKSLKTAVEAVSGKGAKIKSVDADGTYPVLQYLDF